MRAPAVALAAVVLAATVGGCGVAERREARQADEPGAVATGTAPAPEDGGATADPGPAQEPEEIVPTDGLTEEQVIEIETALIDAEAVLASIEAELAQDE
ncbi:MAG: hypothetical protein ACFCVF_07035 [Kineosporiaceae bacterium]